MIRYIIVDASDAEVAMTLGYPEVRIAKTRVVHHPKPSPQSEWPLWATALKHFAKPQDTGIGDVVATIIGPEKSAKFKLWYKATFGKTCGCSGRQARWNQMYPLPDQ